MKRRSWIWFLVSGLLAVLAGAVAIVALLSFGGGQEEVQVAPQMVVVATSPIAAGSIVRIDWLALEGRDQIPSGVYVSVDEVVGRKALADIALNEVILAQDIEQEGPAAAQVLSPEFPDDKIAVALPADDILSQWGAVVPGDHVDVLFTIDVILETDMYPEETLRVEEGEVLQRLERDQRLDQVSVLTLQNGLGNLEVLRAWKGHKAFGGTTTMGAQLVSAGHVKVSGLGRVVIGADQDEAGAREIADMFSGCGLTASVTKDIVAEIWAKAVVNSCINPMTAVLRVPNGRLLESETVVHLMSDICDECTAVAESAGVTLPEKRMMDRVRSVAEDTAANRSSMLRDVELGRRTEIGQLNGMICRIGSANGVQTPLNRAMAAMVEAMQPACIGKA